VPRTVGVFEGDLIGDGAPNTVIELGSTSLERMVTYLAGLRPPCEVLEPSELRAGLRAHAEALAGANAKPRRRRSTADADA
jgi:predicted DNA-binding transcriptional regulator YafY